MTAAKTPRLSPTLTWHDGEFLKSGVPHRILSGSIHYFRIHPDQWEDRLRRVAATGFNTIDTYVAWNFHEQDEGSPDFTRPRDLARFVTIAGDLGLDVIVRPGPYICAEWTNGGLPSWLTARTRAPRSSDPVYQDAAAPTTASGQAPTTTAAASGPPSPATTPTPPSARTAGSRRSSGSTATSWRPPPGARSTRCPRCRRLVRVTRSPPRRCLPALTSCPW